MKVVILACAPRSFEHPADAEVWVINGPRLPERWDRLFQLHGLDHIENKHRDFLRDLAVISAPQRLYMTRTYREPIEDPYLPEGIPAAERFPIERLKEAAGSYLTSSLPIVLAFAVMEGATEVTFDGLMYAGGGDAQWGASEGWARPCLEYHIGRARALGVKVTVPPGCGLFSHSEFVYGFEGPGSV